METSALVKQEKMKWECQKCGACCRIFFPYCEHYDKEKKLCKNYDNRPWMCVQKTFLGDEYAVDTCSLMRHLIDWRDEMVGDRTRWDRIIKQLKSALFGATNDEMKKIEEQITDEDKEIIKKDMKLYKNALREGI